MKPSTSGSVSYPKVYNDKENAPSGGKHTLQYSSTIELGKMRSSNNSKSGV